MLRPSPNAALLLVGCAATPTYVGPSESFAPESTRYRLELRNNAVDPAQAFRCFGACQAAGSQETYLACLSECPGFEATPGARCTAADVTPTSACITVSTTSSANDSGAAAALVVILGGVALSVAAANLCAQPMANCFSSWPQAPLPPAGPQ